nr:transposase [Cylindrospermopsis raciborskii]
MKHLYSPIVPTSLRCRWEFSWVKGINNKLKLIKRLGYGLRNLNNFRLRSLLHWHFSINCP